MKCISIFDVKTNCTLKVKGHTLIITGCEASSNSKDKIKGDGQASSHLVTIWEADDLEEETELAEELETSKNGEGFYHGPANGKFLMHYFP